MKQHMFSSLFIVGVVLFCALSWQSTSFAQPITVLKPNGGEILTVGLSYSIEWSAPGVTNNVFIEYRTGASDPWIPITSVSAGALTYSWTVPNTPTSTALVQIRDTTNALVTDMSDGIFSIIGGTPTLTITSPIGGESWVNGSTHPITWISTNISFVSIVYSLTGVAPWTPIATHILAIPGSFSWILNVGSTSVFAKILITDDGSSTQDESGLFTITSPPNLTLDIPTALGISWPAVTSHDISWTADPSIQFIQIEYSINSGTNWTFVATAAAPLGTYPWIVPNTPTTTALVRITDSMNVLATDVSDNFFEITAAPPSLILTLPNGGENWKIGSTHPIAWISASVTNVVLDYSLDNITWISIPTTPSPLPASTGSYPWEVPSVTLPATQCLVRVSDAGSPAVNDQSNVFTISSPWQDQSPPTTNPIRDVSFIDSLRGWVVGDEIFKTTDGGNLWINQTPSGVPSGVQWKGVSFIDADHGWVAGTKSGDCYVIGTADGGANWSSTVGPTISSFICNDISFADNLNGWVVGDGGKIYRSVNGGSTWGGLVTPTGNDLYGVNFLKGVGITTGWAVGGAGAGAIVNTTTGSAWGSQSNPSSDPLNDVSFIDGSNGWIVGNVGTILATPDGGLNWTSQPSGTLYNLNGVSFSSTASGWAVGDNGTILKYDLSLLLFRKSKHLGQAASGWSIIPSGTTNDLHAVAVLSGGAGWISGNLGTVLHYEASEGVLGVNYANGWNLVSVPLTVADYTKTVLFPTATTNAFEFEGHYTATNTLENGRAYFLKLASSGIVSMTGLARTEDIVDVTEGWHMVGSLSSSIPVSNVGSIPGGIVTSNFYGYDGGYSSSPTIEPGKGYWVKVSQAGQLILSTTANIPAINRIRIEDTGELPPPPPDEVPFEIPEAFTLEQNYPNPFNPVTTITYSLPVGEQVKLFVYNILGQKVAVLVNEVQEPGFKTVSFDARHLPSGVYTYRITAGTFTAVKKMLLIK